MAHLNKNILAVSWAMPPLLFPRALQISRLFKQWQLHGWRTTVLTVDPSSLGRRVLLDPNLESFYKPYYTSMAIASPEGSLALRGLLRLAPFLKQMPDEKRWWATKAFKATRELRVAEYFSTVISFAQPWSSHLVGLRLQENTHLPWIAHFSDPWTVGSHARMSPWAMFQARQWEELVVQRANRLVFVTQEAADATMERYPKDLKRKVRVVPHGFDRDILNALKPTPFPERRPLTLVHTGHFYGSRTPWALLKALSALNRVTSLPNALQVQFIGHIPPDFLETIKALGLEPVIKLLGPKSYLESLQALRDADVLLLIEAASSQNNLYFPSKLVDYFLFQKPIFALTSSRGPSATLLRELQCPAVEPEDVQGIQNALQKLIDQRQSGSLRVSSTFGATVDAYDIRRTATTFQSILEEDLRK